MTDEDLERAVMRRLSEANLIINTHQGGIGFHPAQPARMNTLNPLITMSPEDRREYISNVLLPKKLVLKNNRSDKESPQVSASGEVETDRLETVEVDTEVHKTVEDGGNDDVDSEYCCAICLNEYEDGDAVCTSNNRYCNHMFHAKCIGTCRSFLMRGNTTIGGEDFIA